ncbi:MAG: hypothetical protein AAFO94_13630, partial [Bacteroidota bacterium]
MKHNSKKVRVRLVPKTKDGTKALKNFGNNRKQQLQRLKPDLAKAEKAFGKIQTWRLLEQYEARITASHAIELKMTPEEINQFFQSKRSAESVNEAYQLKGSSSKLFQLGRKLEIPAKLKDEIEYAYIPAPPQRLVPEVDILPTFEAISHFHRLDKIRHLLGVSPLAPQLSGKGIRVMIIDSGFGFDHAYFSRFDEATLRTIPDNNRTDDHGAMTMI